MGILGAGGLSVAQALVWPESQALSQEKGSWARKEDELAGHHHKPLATTPGLRDLSQGNSPGRKTPGPSLLRGGELGE